MSIPCFFTEPTGMVKLYLRRYQGDLHCRQNEMKYHDTMAEFMTTEVIWETWEDGGQVMNIDFSLKPPHDDPRWPTQCVCGYLFKPGDNWQLCPDYIYRRIDNGEEFSSRNKPVGALWYADWKTFDLGPDGHSLYCKTPGGDWCIDSRANNCTLPNDNEHRCWVRHGDPRDPQGKKSGVPLHVDKNGLTCAAGAGSIQCNDYHGFLHNGHLT